MREQLLKSNDLLLREMAAIVYNDINVLNLVFEPHPEIAIALIAYENFDGVALVRFTSGLDIDPIYLA